MSAERGVRSAVRGARVIYLPTTDRQTVIYYSTNPAQELIYFDSNTYKKDKKVIVSFRFFQLTPSHKEILPTVLTVTLLFTCISYVVDERKNITPSNVVETKTDVSKVSK